MLFKTCSFCNKKIKLFNSVKFKDKYFCKDCLDLYMQIHERYSFKQDMKAHCPNCNRTFEIRLKIPEKIVVEAPVLRATLADLDGIYEKSDNYCDKCKTLLIYDDEEL